MQVIRHSDECPGVWGDKLGGVEAPGGLRDAGRADGGLHQAGAGVVDVDGGLGSLGAYLAILLKGQDVGAGLGVADH